METSRDVGVSHKVQDPWVMSSLKATYKMFDHLVVKFSLVNLLKKLLGPIKLLNFKNRLNWDPPLAILLMSHFCRLSI